jgi:hypothetical protein
MSDPSIAHEQDLDGYHMVIRHATVEEYDNPREEGESPCTMICFSSRYNLGDDHTYVNPSSLVAELVQRPSVEYPGEAMDPDELYYAVLNDRIKEELDHSPRSVHGAILELLEDAPLYCLPLYLYDHSGITMNTTGFHCGWDSGQVGLIYITEEDAKEAWPDLFPDMPEMTDIVADLFHKTQTAEVLERVKAEVTEYDLYLTNSAYSYDLWPIKKPGKKYKRHKSIMVDEQYGTLCTLADMRKEVEQHIGRLNEERRQKSAQASPNVEAGT